MKYNIVKALLQAGSSSIVALAQELGTSVPTLTKYLQDLLADGYVRQLGKSGQGKGRKAVFYGVDPTACYFVGVEIKKFAVALTMTDLSGDIVRTSQIEGGYDYNSSPSFLENLCQSIIDFINEDPVVAPKVKMVALNIPGRVNSETGRCYTIFNFEGDDTPLSTILFDRIGVPVVIENDTASMTYGEMQRGHLGCYRNALFINFNWGVGMGIVLDGKLYRGMDGFAGELGHINVFDNEKLCHCGKKGCLETEVSVRAISEKLEQQIREGKTSMLSSYVLQNNGKVTPDLIRSAIEREDTLVMEIMEKTGGMLGRQIANLINIFNPEAVVVGGFSSIVTSEYFITSIKQAITKYALKLIHKNVVVESTSLGEKAGALGACLGAREKYLQKRYSHN